MFGGTEYRYGELQAGEIRILRLKPAADASEALECELFSCSLANAPKFEAISYVWGPQVFPEVLLVGADFLRITCSLASALKRFRPEAGTRLLWADAVCINQQNNQEKAQQVALMGSIYKSGARCLAWLGEGTAEIAHAIQRCPDLAEEAKSLGLSPGEFDSEHSRGPSVKRKAIKNGMQDFSESYIEPIWKRIFEAKLENLVELPWFSRLWIIQEVALSSTILVHCGALQIDWEVLTMVFTLTIALHRDFNKPVGEHLSRVWNIVVLRNKYRLYSSSLLHFESCFEQFGSDILRSCLHDCHDERDRIYAMANLRPATSPLRIQPDYSKSVEEVYKDMAAQFVNLQDPRVLYQSGLYLRKQPQHPMFDHSPVNKILPSWVPEYRPSKLNSFSLPWTFSHFHSCTDGPPVRLSLVDSNLGLLGMACHVFDTISAEILSGSQLSAEASSAWPSTAFQWRTTFPDDLQLGFERIIHAMSVFAEAARKPRKKYHTGEDVRVALIRTLLGDLSDDRVRRLFPTHIDLTNEADVLTLWNHYEALFISRPDGFGGFLSALPSGNELQTLSEDARMALNFHLAAVDVLQRSKFVITKQGFIGLAPPLAQEHDVVIRIGGWPVPWLARPLPLPSLLGGPICLLIGPCFIHGIMYDEGPSWVTSENDLFFL